MDAMFEAEQLTKRFDEVTALEEVSVTFPRHSVIGLVGRNGSGKTTLLNHVVGLYLPSAGRATTLGRPSGELGSAELSRMGYVPQETRFLEWMSVDGHIDYVAGFYPHWDREREARLRDDLELDGDRQVGALSAGNVQKLALVLAVCHHPELLVVDEPVSDLDPIVRSRLLAFLLELIRDDESTVVVSSHVLRDVEQIVDRVICLHRGRVTADASLDELQESFAQWSVTAGSDGLPDRFEESFILRQEIEGRQARLVVRPGPGDLEAFRSRHGVEVTIRSLNLEGLFPFLASEENRR
jgi:ABC-2 type transport system ATP-binding protein